MHGTDHSLENLMEEPDALLLENALGPSRRGPRKAWLFLATGVLALVALGVAFPLLAPSGKTLGQKTWSYPIALPGQEALPSFSVQASILPDDARALNTAVPFVKGVMTTARPFRFAGSTEDRARAEHCLAAAQLYEAGLSSDDQKAVAQVVLNRVRHPAFPHNICSVVFEGAERLTGCQFTFTCDGSLVRRYPKKMWDEARALASQMLNGMVDARVGLATHYHTDWVYPYWSSSLDKLSAVGTHLFFRWKGYWGTSPAFAASYAGGEPIISKLMGEVPLLTTDLTALEEKVAIPADGIRPALRPLADIAVPGGLSPEILKGNGLKLVHPDGGGYGLLMRQDASAEELLGIALRLCYDQDFCKVMAWSSAGDVPRGFPISPTSAKQLRFSYVRDPKASRAQTRYDCSLFSRTKIEQCL